MTVRRERRAWSPVRGIRFGASWLIALVLVAFVLPQAIGVTWSGLAPAFGSLGWTSALTLVALWFLGLVVHTFVLTAAAPSLTHRRALTLNLTGSAVSNVVPLGGAAGVELNRRMMKAWGLDAQAFTGYTFLTNLWDVGAKLLLPVVAVIALARGGDVVTTSLRTASLAAGSGFLGLVTTAALLLLHAGLTDLVARRVERAVRVVLRLLGRDRELGLPAHLAEIRRECAQLVATGWLRMSIGMIGYVTLQCVLLGWCLHLTGGGNTWMEVLTGFAVERLLTVLPITPGGVGVADLGLVGTLVALHGDPVATTAAAVLYRAFVFVVEIPIGGGALGLWLFQRRREGSRLVRGRELDSEGINRVAHVTDVFLPRLGGIETHVDDLVRHQRAAGLDARVLTPVAGAGTDPPWVHRLPAGQARHEISTYDVVHVHLSMFSPYGIRLARVAMSSRVPTVITVHSMWTGTGPLLRLVAFASLRRWPVVWTAVSAAAAQAFQRSLGSLRVEILPNAIDAERWRPALPARPVGAGEVERPLTLISTMRLMPRKRPVQLLRMLQLVHQLTTRPDVRLVLVGDGPLRGRVERYVRRHGLGDRVRITGRLERSEVRAELSAATVYVAPAPKESFGIAALEARCAGLPVVAFGQSGVGEFVRDRVDGLLVRDDAEMAAAIADLVVDDALLGRITAHNRRHLPDVGWSDVLERTRLLYGTALERARVAAPATVAASEAGAAAALVAETA